MPGSRLFFDPITNSAKCLLRLLQRRPLKLQAWQAVLDLGNRLSMLSYKFTVYQQPELPASH